MKAATITIRCAPDAVRDALRDAADLRCSFIAAPGGRGVEVHASSASLDQKAMKAALRNCRALLEAGEAPTGERRP